MPAIVSGVNKNSIAQDLGFEVGDEILELNGVTPKDLIDYSFLMKIEELTIKVKSKDGNIISVDIEKDYDEDLGIIFESAVFDKIKRCQNHCIFCFVDQQPKGMRKSLYVKDDDYRLSYLQGTYITLTNITEEDKKRILQCHLGPLYISIHTTNPELRVKMLNNKNAGESLKLLDWFLQNDIPIHTQIVLCPGYNDKKELVRTLNDLAKYKKIIKSIAVVPVGTTKFRKNPLKRVDKKIATDTIDIIDNFNKKVKKQLACASDEFFILAEKIVPDKKYYSNFEQLDDGIGTLRLIIDDFERMKKKFPNTIKKSKTVHLAIAESSYKTFYPLLSELNKIKNLTVIPVLTKNIYFGNEVTVAGLLTGTDLLNTFEKMKDEITYLVIPSVMIKPYTNKFLDDMSVEDIEKKLDCKIIVNKNCYSLKEIIDFCIS